jgi:hypothetical protein
MKIFLVVLLIIVSSRLYGQASNLAQHTWAYNAVAFIYQQDTLYFFQSDSVQNIWYLDKIRLSFSIDGNYTGTDVAGKAQAGTWSMPNSQSIIVDADTNQIISQSTSQLVTSSPFVYNVDTLHLTGTLLTVLYVPELPVSICSSVKSGDWADANTWSCGRQPTINDIVTINLNHVVLVSTIHAEARRISLQGGAIEFTTINGKVLIKEDD